MSEHKESLSRRGTCHECREAWPCTFARLRSGLAAVLARAADLEAERNQLRAALEMAEKNTWMRATTGGQPVRVCRICDQIAYGEGDRINHAPDCPFAVLAGQPDSAHKEHE